MKRWAILTVLLYAAALLLLTAPVIWIVFSGWSGNGVTWHNTLTVYQYWAYWLWLGIFVAGQALLLLVPINLAERRLPARRPLKIPVLVTAFFLANLCFAGLLSLLCLWFKEDGLDFFGYFLPFKPNQVAPTDFSTEFGAVVIGLTFWIIWGIVFRRFARADDPDTLLRRILRWLLRGSVLELLVAVPSHIIVRRRGDCCAPLGTFWGIATGISVMLLCFGPGVYFLFVERCQRLRPKPQTDDKASSPANRPLIK